MLTPEEQEIVNDIMNATDKQESITQENIPNTTFKRDTKREYSSVTVGYKYIINIYYKEPVTFSAWGAIKNITEIVEAL